MILSFPLPIPDSISDHLIKLVHHSLIIEKDFELTQVVEMVFYTNHNGDFGIPLIDSINLNPNLTPEQKARQLQVFKSQTRTVGTRGHFIDPITQNLVERDEAGELPEGAIPEMLLWHEVLSSKIPGEKLSDKVKALLMQSMQKMVERKRI